MFVYYTYTDDGSLVMINTYKGTDSIFKVSDNKKEKVLNWLNGQLSGLDEDFYKMKEYGYLDVHIVDWILKMVRTYQMICKMLL